MVVTTGGLTMAVIQAVGDEDGAVEVGVGAVMAVTEVGADEVTAAAGAAVGTEKTK